MAYIGMKYVVAAAISTETVGTAITYQTGSVIGKAISGNVTWDRNDNPLYADDTIAEDDNSITGGSIELGLDDLSDAARVSLLGDEETAGASSAPSEYETAGDPSPYVGFGYIRVRRKGGSTTYQACWYHKVQFGETSENAQTKGQSIEWQTPTLTGRIMGVQNDSSLTTHYRRRVEFTTEASAKTWLNTKAGIT